MSVIELVVPGDRLTARAVLSAARRAHLPPSPPPNAITVCAFRNEHGLPYPTAHPIADAEAVIQGLYRAGVLYAPYCVVALELRTNHTIDTPRAQLRITSHSNSLPRKDRR